jgi:hypothetical protein
MVGPVFRAEEENDDHRFCGGVVMYLENDNLPGWIQGLG